MDSNFYSHILQNSVVFWHTPVSSRVHGNLSTHLFHIILQTDQQPNSKPNGSRWKHPVLVSGARLPEQISYHTATRNPEETKMDVILVFALG